MRLHRGRLQCVSSTHFGFCMGDARCYTREDELRSGGAPPRFCGHCVSGAWRPCRSTGYYVSADDPGHMICILEEPPEFNPARCIFWREGEPDPCVAA